MTNIEEHFKKYPCIRLPNGHQYEIKAVEYHRLVDRWDGVLSIHIGRKWISAGLDSLDINWRHLRTLRRQFAIQSEVQWNKY